MFENFKKILLKSKDLLALGSSGIFGTIILGTFWLFLAGFLGPRDYGEISYYFALAVIAVSISSLSLQTGMTVFVAKELKIKNAIYTLGLVSSITAAIVTFLIFSHFEVSLFVVGASFFGLTISEILGKKFYRQFSLYNILQKILAVFLAILFYYLIGLEGIILGFAISYFFFAKGIYKLIIKRNFTFSQIGSKLKFIANNYIAESTENMLWWSDRFIILPYFGFALLGNYHLGIQALQLMAIVPLVAFQYLLPRDSVGKASKRIKILTMVISIILAVFSFIFGPIIIEAFLPNFVEAKSMIQILSLALIPISLNLLFNSYFLGLEKSKIVAVGHSIQLIIHLITIVFLSTFYGPESLPYGFLIATTSASIFFISVVKFLK